MVLRAFSIFCFSIICVGSCYVAPLKWKIMFMFMRPTFCLCGQRPRQEPFSCDKHMFKTGSQMINCNIFSSSCVCFFGLIAKQFLDNKKVPRNSCNNREHELKQIIFESCQKSHLFLSHFFRTLFYDFGLKVLVAGQVFLTDQLDYAMLLLPF